MRPQKEINGCFNIAASVGNCECIVVASSVLVLGGNAKWSFQSKHAVTFGESAECFHSAVHSAVHSPILQ